MEALEEPLAVVGQDVPPPIRTTLPEPEKVGIDRLCAAGAAYGRLAQACVVVDLGTAVTIDCVDDEGIFRGGVILPGTRMQAAALHRATAQLPEVTLREPDWVFGRNTEEAIIGGIVYGLRGAIRERVEAYATELGQWPLVVFTGGDAPLMKMDEGFVQAIVPGLCLVGIARAFYQSLLPEKEQAAGGQAEGEATEE
jgi:type III pantothenate kinase